MSTNSGHHVCGIEVSMFASQANRRELLQTLGDLRDRLAADKDDCECDFFEDLSEPNRFLWTEWWTRTEMVDQAMESTRFRTLLGAIKVLGSLQTVRRLDRTGETRNQSTNRSS